MNDQGDDVVPERADVWLADAVHEATEGLWLSCG
jgi:hypothetical protein